MYRTYLVADIYIEFVCVILIDMIMPICHHDLFLTI